MVARSGTQWRALLLAGGVVGAVLLAPPVGVCSQGAGRKAGGGFTSEHGLVPGRWWLVEYFANDTPAAVSRAVWSDVAVRRFSGTGVGERVIVAEHAASLAVQFARRGFVSPPELDLGGKLARVWGVRDERDHIWLVDPSGGVRFANGGSILREEDLRQVLERYLTVPGKPADSGGADPAPLGAGSKLPPLLVEDARSGENLLLDLASAAPRMPAGAFSEVTRRVVFLTADCTMCSLGSALDELADACRLAPQGEQPELAVFSARFSASEVREGALQRGITLPLYIAHRELPGLEDLYRVRSLRIPIAVVDLDVFATVKSMGSLSDFLRSLAPQEPPGHH